jgi:hypothetical protein
MHPQMAQMIADGHEITGRSADQEDSMTPSEPSGPKGREREPTYAEGESPDDPWLSLSGYVDSRIPRVFDPRWAHLVSAVICVICGSSGGPLT